VCMVDVDIYTADVERICAVANDSPRSIWFPQSDQIVYDAEDSSGKMCLMYNFIVFTKQHPISGEETST
jgi:hypothetical protein